MKFFVPLAFAVVLSGCGGSASGPVGAACIAADRRAATSRLCGCVQRVARDHLSASEQRRAAEFFTDPDKAQAARGSAFWSRYQRFSRAAERSCR